jgi:phosphonate degradation associated HDIG domain protein
MSQERRFEDVDDVVGVLTRWGAQHYDDRVTQLDHALQCATLARAAAAPDALVAAALLHDIGHLIELERSGGTIGDLTVDRHHEHVAARALAALFPAEVVAPVALHVEAKRYLCAIDPAYVATLSEGSVRSLVTQGGPMDADEVARFERHPQCRAAADLRRWDDAGKVDGLSVPPLADLVPLLHAVARG